MTTTRAHSTRPRPPGSGARGARRGLVQVRVRHRRLLVGAVAGLLAIAVVVGVAVGGRGTSKTASGVAPPFELASTAGGRVSLADYRGRNVLLYFNEGVGCDACFYQTARLEADPAFGRLDVTLLPVVVNPTERVRPELRRFGIRTPYLSDPDGAVSRAYGVLGTGHHAELPGHVFVLVGPDGRLRWRGDYPGMWVEPGELTRAVAAELGRDG